MINDNGLIPLRFEDVNRTISQNITSNIDIEMDLSSNSIMGVFKDIFSLHESFIWELSQDVYDSAYPLSAENEFLDNLALLIGVVRGNATRTRGIVWLKSVDGYKVYEGDALESVTGAKYLIESDGLITTLNSLSAEVFIESLIEHEDYTLSIDDNVIRRASTPDQTAEEILTGLHDGLLLNGSVISTLFLETEPQYISIEKIDKSQSMRLAGSSYLGFREVISPVLAIAEISGNNPAKADTVTKFLPDQDNVAVNNPSPLVTGSDTQTNLELRREGIGQFNSVSGGTPDKLLDVLLGIAGVSSAKVIENREYAINDDMPPNSYKVVVYGGDEGLVAESLWKTTPAGIQAYSDLLNENTIKKSIIDFNNQIHTMYFLRPETKYLWGYVTYTKYDEEAFSNSGEEIMKNEIANFGQSLGIGNDVITDRFYPSIYSNVRGVEDTEIYFAVTDDINTTPTYPADYSQANISITDEQITDFSASRVQVQEVV